MEFPLYIESKKESMPNEIHEVNMQAQDFQNPKPKDDEMPSEKDTKWRNHHLEDIIKIHQGMRYPLIHTKLKMSNSQREDGSKQTKHSTKFHDGTKYQKKKACLPPTHLIRITKKSVLKKIE